MHGMLRGQSLARILMNESLAHETMRGRVIDVGGGRNPDYFAYLKKENVVSIEAVDASFTAIDFEIDPLPFTDAYADTVLLCNVLEHIYAHQYVLKQVHRVLKEGGQLIGFVPFWVGYHPDPHDYFRYTNEALQRMLHDAGFKNIRILPIGGGPFFANFNTIVLSLPRVARPLVYLFYVAIDTLFVILRPKSRMRNPLGYQFNAYV
jgi:SAM-dependent methyltransferase